MYQDIFVFFAVWKDKVEVLNHALQKNANVAVKRSRFFWMDFFFSRTSYDFGNIVFEE